MPRGGIEGTYPDEQLQSWESIWSRILRQSVRNAVDSDKFKSNELPYSISAILLARTAWDSFLNEFVQWRNLSVELDKLSFRNSVKNTFDNLSERPIEFDQPGIWSDLDLLNDLRNELVHHKAVAREWEQSPKNVLARLNSKLKLPAFPSPIPWEQKVLCSETAKWACLTVGQAILELEKIPTARTRSFGEIQRIVLAAISDLRDLSK